MLKAIRALPVAIVVLMLPGLAVAQSVSVGVLGGFDLLNYCVGRRRVWSLIPSHVNPAEPRARRVHRARKESR